MATTFKKIYHKAGLDSAVVFAILGKVVQSVGGVMTLLLITGTLTKNEQGYYYTFASILSLQLFFELGLTSIITQYIAHEAAHLSWDGPEMHGDHYYKSRLASIVHFSVKWFLVMALLLVIVLLFAGRFFFSRYNNELNVSWQTPWVILSLSTALILLLDLVFAILEGVGKIREVSKLRLVQQLCNLTLLCAFLLNNARLLSNGMALLCSTLTTAIVLLSSGYLKVIKNIWETEIKERVNYRKEIFPYQYRIGLGYMSSYLIYQLFNPVLFATQGPVVAGQMGATQAVLNGILAISLTWMSTKVALLSNLVARQELRELNAVYNKNMRMSLGFCVMGLTGFAVILTFLKANFPDLGNRFLEFIPVIFLSLTQIANVIGSSQGFYLRSFKKEPFFIPSVVIGIVSATTTVLCSRYFGVTGMSIGYFVINGIAGFSWGCIIFNSKKYKEHITAYHQTGNL